ncbi:MAG: FtsW/RodA/SpoVE family cell cycle protein [Gemmatimonadaceae bacterium]|nr:FtsW/RodA/SpoVE family cell cycle protein [Gemmatimonadaceae bacterium]
MTSIPFDIPAAPRRDTPAAVPGFRERWRMGVEARALVLVTAILLAIGLATVFSASFIEAQQKGFGSTYYLSRQAIAAAAGIVGFAILAKIDAERFRRLAWPMMLVSIAAMGLVLLAGAINGSARFAFGRSFQPSEFVKFAVVVWTAMMIVRKGERLRRFTKGVIPIMLVVGILAALAFKQPDVSVALFYLAVAGTMLFISGARIGHFLLIGLLVLPLMWKKLDGYVQKRICTYTNSCDAAVQREFGLQTRQSLVAIGSGGLVGVGYGEGRQQGGFLPHQISDFIASNIGEEWGFVGMGLVTALFVGYGWLGFRIARDARSPFLQLVAVGITLTTVTTALVHLAVVTGLFPNTGLTLPFISHGGSNMLLSLAMTGVLVNIGSARERVPLDPASR